MALSKDQREQITALFKKGGLSNVKIAKEVGCSESAVRVLVKKLGAEKNEITNLAKQEITNTIIANEINEKKNEFNDAEKRAYQEVFTSMSEGLNLFNNSAVKNQSLLNHAQDAILESAKEKDGSIDGSMLVGQLPNILAISKGTESNRKQILGNTETYKPEPDSTNKDENTIEGYEVRTIG